MALQQNTDRIQTTHIGSLPRPHALLNLMKAKYALQPYNQRTYDSMLAEAVKEAVRKQVECGIDIVTDGEFSKPGFFTYIQERLEGFERRPDQKMKLFQKEFAAFPEYYAEYFKQAMMSGAIVGLARGAVGGGLSSGGRSLCEPTSPTSSAPPRPPAWPMSMSSCRPPRRRASAS